MQYLNNKKRLPNESPFRCCLFYYSRADNAVYLHDFVRQLGGNIAVYLHDGVSIFLIALIDKIVNSNSKFHNALIVCVFYILFIPTH